MQQIQESILCVCLCFIPDKGKCHMIFGSRSRQAKTEKAHEIALGFILNSHQIPTMRCFKDTNISNIEYHVICISLII